MNARPSLVDPIPTDILMGSSGFLLSYRKYPSFSAPWLWRRMMIFGPIAIAVGLMQATILGLAVHDIQFGLLLGTISVLSNLAIVTIGPAFATLIRHQRLPSQVERSGIVLAVLTGVVLNCAAQYVTDTFVIQPQLHLQMSRIGISSIGLESLLYPSRTAVLVRWTIEAFILFFLGGGTALRSYFDEQRARLAAQQVREIAALRREKSEANMKLTVLQAQVEPHFLFNTLASIHSLIRSDPGRAELTLEALVKHLRTTLPRFRSELGSTHSTLDQQVDICKSYLELMRVRMGNRLRYTIDVPQSLRGHPFPPLMLISLVDNAIKHGIEPTAADGNIVIKARVENGAAGKQLDVTVSDDGVGLQSELGSGVGLRNVREQLAAQFATEGMLLIRSGASGGVSATIRVPYVEAPIMSLEPNSQMRHPLPCPSPATGRGE